MKISFKAAMKIRWLAAIISSLMYASFYDQARINCSGSIGSIWLASAALVSCILWIVSSYFREKIDWQTIIACAIGLITTTVAIITAVQPVIICSYIK